MLTTGKGPCYCVHCGFDMRAREQRECQACDGDLCQPKKLARKFIRFVDTRATGYAVKVWPVRGDARHSWLNRNGGYVISVLERAVWGTKEEARDAYRAWSGMAMKLVRVSFNEIQKRPVRGEP